jgi:hypothetical protein
MKKPQARPIIETEWRNFAELVLPVNAPTVQHVEMRCAFYAGAMSLFHALITGLDDGEEPTEADIAKMDSIKAEFDRFEADLASWRA